jgi:hypothetical protein
MKYAWIEKNKLLWPVCVQCRERWLGLFEQIPAIPKWRVCLG